MKTSDGQFFALTLPLQDLLRPCELITQCMNITWEGATEDTIFMPSVSSKELLQVRRRVLIVGVALFCLSLRDLAARTVFTPAPRE